jgi:hypothetical protein
MRFAECGSLFNSLPGEELTQIASFNLSLVRSRDVVFCRRTYFIKYILILLALILFILAPDVPLDSTTMILSEHPRLREQGEVKLSLWLLPPEDVSSKIQSQIDAFTHRPGASASFVPHVTLVGGITCETSEQVQQVTKALELGLSGVGGIPIRLAEAQSQNLWSQALYLPVNASKEFVELCQYCREILGMDDGFWEFPQPAGVPHLSLYYGTENIPAVEDVKRVKNFVATRVGLWKTDPSTVEGVEFWRPLVIFDLM